MIEFLHIENVAVVKSLDIEFSGGLTALTGETGAGKSIIIDSLNLLSGARADKELLRVGESRAEVSAVFSKLDGETVKKIEELGFSATDGSVMLSRSFTQSSSSARLNGKPITLSLLREAAGFLFGIHGQNDNMLLLEPKNHIRILDSYANNKELLNEYTGYYHNVLELRAELDSLCEDVMEQNRMREILRYQIDDIDSVKLKKGEEEELEALAVKLRSIEKISKSCALVDKALNGGKGMGAIYLTDRAASAMQSVSDALPEAEGLANRLSEVKYELEDIVQSVSALCDIGGENPTAKLDKIEARLDAISKLKRKYGATVEEVFAFRADAAKRLDFIDNAEDRKIDIENELHAQSDKAKAVARKLSQSRISAAHGLTRSVCETLEFLDMPKVRFEVAINKSNDLNAFGCDEIEFLLSANAGEPLMPMARIASGGELSRIMLSLKNVLNTSDGIDTVVFDEIDTGISGKTSRKVGIKLKEIGKSSQVICVTHSAQIASLANQHLYVSKRELDGRTESSVKMLAPDERVEEIARILGGIEISDVQVAAAREMIEEGKNY